MREPHVLKNATRAITAMTIGAGLSLAAVAFTALPASADTGDDVDMGSGSSAVAFSIDSSLAYVSGGNNVIKVLDTATHAIIDTITLPGIVGGTAMSPDGATLYASDGVNNNVYAIDTTTRAIGAPIAAGATPTPVVITHDGAYVYVGNLVNSSVTVINTSTNLVVDTISLPISPSTLRVAPDDSIVWAMTDTSPDAIMIDTGTHAATPFTPDATATGVLDVIYRESLNEILFVTFDGTNGGVAMYFLPGLTPGGSMAGLPAGPFIAGAVDATQDILWLIDMGSATIKSFPGGASAPVGPGPWSIAVRPDGLEVWVPSIFVNTVTIFTRPYTGNESATTLFAALGDTVTIDSAVPAGTYDTLRWQYYDFGLATWQDMAGETGPTLDVVLDATSENYRYRLVATSAVFGDVLSGQWAIGETLANTGAGSGSGSGELANTGADGVGTTTGIAAALVLVALAFLGARRRIRA